MSDRILIVDDEQNVLNSLRRQLEKKYNIQTALGAVEALKLFREDQGFAVVLSDLRMPEMDGLQFLSKVKEISPYTIGIILTGNADLNNAIKAVNDGHIFRFLTKPCPMVIIENVLKQAIEQYRLVTSEKEILEKTLKGSIRVLTELLAILSPEAFGRSMRIKRYVSKMANELDLENTWQIETAAMLSLIGYVTLPEETTKKLQEGEELTPEEQKLFKQHPKIASYLISHIPRMDEVAEIIEYQDKHFDGSGTPNDFRRGDEIPLGARILKVIMDYDRYESKNKNTPMIIKNMKENTGCYDPSLLATLEVILGIETRYVEREILMKDMKVGMVLAEDIKTPKGILIVPRGNEISPVLIRRLRNFAYTTGIHEPIIVLEPKNVS